MILDDLLEEPKKSIYDLVVEARHEAIRNGIKANSIVINRDLVRVPEEPCAYPEMICGLKCHITTKELPEDYAFAVLHDPRQNCKEELSIPVDTVRSYLLELIEEWNTLGDRKYELPNMQVYNHIRKELDDLEEYTQKHFPNGDCK